MNPVRAKTRQRIPFLLFLALYLVFSFWTFRDYGATWDEQEAYQGGTALYNYLLHGVKPAYLDPEHSYPYTFLLNFITSKVDFEFLHLLNLLFATFLFWAVFEVLLAQYGKRWWALAGPVFLFFNLPFLGSIPANPKDVPFAIFYFISLAAIYLFEEKSPQFKVRWAILGSLFGITICSRIVGFTLFPILIFFDTYGYWTQKKKRGPKGWKKWFKPKALDWLGALVVSQFFCIILWPYLGENYFSNIFNVIGLSTHFPPRFESLFMGSMTDSLTYPWYYLPLWICITAPLFILVFFIYSFFMSKAVQFNKLYVLLMGTFLFNMGLYLFLHPAIYDGLRHFLFLLPIMSTLAVIAFIEYFKLGFSSIDRKIVGLATSVGMGVTATHLISLHPYEYSYFNELAGGFKGAYGKYETDYWVASMKEAVEWLKSNELKDPNRIYKIFVLGHPPQYQIYFNPQMQYVPEAAGADYSIVMTRAGIKPDLKDKAEIIHRVEREGAPLCFILKLR
jgi:hypothetical protein